MKKLIIAGAGVIIASVAIGICARALHRKNENEAAPTSAGAEKEESKDITGTPVPAERGPGYRAITMAEAKEMFSAEGDYLIVDVRRPEEFAEGHIPGAINIPNESIGTEQPEELLDKEQVIYVYCRSGRRSKEAAQKLANQGYTGIIECGGILDWTGEVLKD